VTPLVLIQDLTVRRFDEYQPIIPLILQAGKLTHYMTLTALENKAHNQT